MKSIFFSFLSYIVSSLARTQSWLGPSYDVKLLEKVYEGAYGCLIINSYPPPSVSIPPPKKKKVKVPYRPTDICPTASRLCLILIHKYLPSIPTFFIFQMSSVFTVYSISNVFPGNDWRMERVGGQVMKSHSLYQKKPRDHFIC